MRAEAQTARLTFTTGTKAFMVGIIKKQPRSNRKSPLDMAVKVEIFCQLDAFQGLHTHITHPLKNQLICSLKALIRNDFWFVKALPCWDPLCIFQPKQQVPPSCRFLSTEAPSKVNSSTFLSFKAQGPLS